MTLSLEQALAISINELSTQKPELLSELKNAASDCLNFAIATSEHVDHAIDLRYREYADRLRTTMCKQTGVVHFDDGNVRITADLPQEIEWHQVRLAEIARRLQANGKNPADYIDHSFSVAEAKFNAWPDSLKNAFIPARTVKNGTPTYRLALMRDHHTNNQIDQEVQS